MNMLAELGSITLDTHSFGGLTDDEFYRFCLDNRDLKFERDAQQNIIIMSNTGGTTGNYNAELLAELILWNRQSKSGFCFDSSTAFKLPSNAVRSPDAAWIQSDRWNALTSKEKEQFPPLCPDFIIEIKSPSDNLSSQKSKMEEWVSNGCRLAWLINPENGTTTVYFNSTMKIVALHEQLSGNPVLPGFDLTLANLPKV